MTKAVMVLLITLILSGCNSDSPEEESSLSSLLPEAFDQTDCRRVGEIRNFVGDSLWEYINGGAEIYHTYGFREVMTADYSSNGTDIVVDLYEFSSADQAYGMYSYLRPDEPKSVEYGVEGFITGSSVDFVIGSLLVRITAFEASEESALVLSEASKALSVALPGTKQAPQSFGRFPELSALPFSDKIVSESFLGRHFLEDVYTRSYLIGQDTLVLLLTEDKAGEKFIEWQLAVTPGGVAPSGFSFDADYAMLVQDDYYGEILTGLKGGYLVGVINYSDSHRTFVLEWLASFK